MSEVNVTTENTNEEPTKAIFNMAIARALVKKGYRIVDIKPRRDNPDAFLPFFEDSLQFRNDWAAIVKERKKNRSERKTREDFDEDVKEPILQED